MEGSQMMEVLTAVMKSDQNTSLSVSWAWWLGPRDFKKSFKTLVLQIPSLRDDPVAPGLGVTGGDPLTS
jgi:hypothetical protein